RRQAGDVGDDPQLGLPERRETRAREVAHFPGPETSLSIEAGERAQQIALARLPAEAARSDGLARREGDSRPRGRRRQRCRRRARRQERLRCRGLRLGGLAVAVHADPIALAVLVGAASLGLPPLLGRLLGGLLLCVAV